MQYWVHMILNLFLFFCSLLRRLLERLLIKTYLMPTFITLEINDQYAYTPIDSTTGLLLDITHKISMLSEVYEYVCCILMHFHKHF